MHLPRRQYLALAGVEVQLFKTLQRRNYVPMFGVDLENSVLRDEEQAAKFHKDLEAGGYTLPEVILLAIADHLALHNSFSRQAARHISEGYWNVLLEAVPRAEAGEEIWYAVGSWDFGHEKQADAEGSRAHWSWVEAGTFDEVVDAIRREKERTVSKRGAVDNIAMFDLSMIVRKAHKRASELGLDIPSFFPKPAS